MNDGPGTDEPPTRETPAARLLKWADRRRGWLFAGVLVLHALAYNGQWRVSPDSALYAELGRNLAEGTGFSYQGEPHTWVEPGLPYAIGFSFRHFGIDNFHPVMLAMLACSVAALSLTYALFTLHAGRPVAVVVTVLLGVSETFFRYGFHLFTDMPFLTAVMAFLLGYELLVRNPRRASPWLLVAAATLFMVAFRPAVITFVGAVGLTCAWHLLRGPGRMRHVVLGGVVLAMFFGFRLVDPRRGVASAGETQRESMLKSLLGDRLGFAVKRMASEWVPMLLEETTTEAVFGMQLGPGISSVVSAGIIAAGVLLVRRRVLWGAWVAATIAQMAFWLPRERYYLPILPLLLFAMWNAGNWLAARMPVRWRGLAPIVIVVALVGPNLVYIGTFIFDQRRRPFLSHYERGEKLRIISLAKTLESDLPPDATLIAEHGRELSYFSRRRVIDPLTARRTPPTDAEYDRLRRKLAEDPSVFVLLPGKKTQALLDRLGGTLGEPISAEDGSTVYPARFTVPSPATQAHDE